MSNFGLGSYKEQYKIFLIGPKQEGSHLKNIVFGVDIPEDGINYLFDKRNSWIACEIKCYSEEDFDRIYSQLEDCLR